MDRAGTYDPCCMNCGCECDKVQKEVQRLQGEVHNRNKRALEGDKSTKAWDALYEAHEKLRIEHDNLKRSVKNHGRGDWCYDNECMMCEGAK